MSDKIELLPCPFCGGKAEKDEATGWIACATARCLAFNVVGSEDDWNRRAALAEQPDTVPRELYTCTDKGGMRFRVEDRNGTLVLIGSAGCRPATEAEAYFAQRMCALLAGGAE